MENINSVARDYFIKNRDLFSDVQDATSRYGDHIRLGEHTVLNYSLIISEMTKYLEGYQRYKRDGNNKYKHDVLSSTYASVIVTLSEPLITFISVGSFIFLNLKR